MLNDEQWQESKRQRKWVTVNEAIDLIHNPKLANIIKTVPDYIEQHAA